MSLQYVISKYNNKIIGILFDEKQNASKISVIDGEEDILGNIYAARVMNVIPSINGAFAEFAKGQKGYIDTFGLSEKIKEGDSVIVQVKKDAVKTKDPVLSAELSISGRYVVTSYSKEYTANTVNISKKITEQSLRAMLKDVLLDALKDFVSFYSIIVRTNAKDASSEEVISEVNAHVQKITNLVNTGSTRKAPILLYSSDNALFKSIIDLPNCETEIITDIPEVYNEVVTFLKENRFNNNTKCVLYQNNDIALNLVYSFEKNISQVLDKKVWLKSGGYLIFDYTEAMTVIDVNSGKNVSKKKSEDEILKLNKEAAAEICRQLILRNISGIIIIDFINMQKDESKDQLISYISELCKNDSVLTSVIDMTPLGLVEITRKKTKKPFYESIKTS